MVDKGFVWKRGLFGCSIKDSMMEDVMTFCMSELVVKQYFFWECEGRIGELI